MKTIKLQEQFFGKDKEFRTTKILKKHPELLDGKPVKFEVVSPDYAIPENVDEKFELNFEKYCGSCEHSTNKECGTGWYDTHYFCSKLDNVKVGAYWSSDRYYASNDNFIKCPKFANEFKGKKLGTMKLELEMVAKGSLRGEGCNYKSIIMNAGHKDTTAEFFISKQEYDFIKDNEYFKENDLVVVLKVSEVERNGK